jgi:hypothetical protein
LDLADAQERYRFLKDSEGPVGGVEVKPARRETQTSDALRRLGPAGSRMAKVAGGASLQVKAPTSR